MKLIDNGFDKEFINQDVPISPFVLKYGMIGSIVLLLILIVEFISIGSRNQDLVSMSPSIFTVSLIIGIGTYIVCMILAILNYKASNKGYASFFSALVITFLTGLVMAMVYMFFSVILNTLFPYVPEGMKKLNVLNTFGSNSRNFLSILISSLNSFILECVLVGTLAIIISFVTKEDRPLIQN